ncbi:YojF family protein [Paenibacillus sp. HB172176]|uniref:YojF family protein n=1 Tax=Paenibacillus sp. HB172176 TaxID=2493690 RepID=UPI00143B8196|nr:YojF family protein [Paenibacillus sp. HB172176]
MQPIHIKETQDRLDSFKNEELYIHLEMTTGAYAAHHDSTKHPAATFITNARIRYSEGSIAGNGPFRVGLKMEQGWVYCEGLTHMEETEQERIIMAGHDRDGKLVVALQLSKLPF